MEKSKLLLWFDRTATFLLSIFVIGWAALLALVGFFPSTYDQSSADCAIVLGAAVWGKDPSPVFRERLNFAAELYHQGKVGFVITTGGKGDGDTYSEGEAGRIYLLGKGIPAANLAAELKSRTTLQNLKFALPILQEKSLRTCLIVSDPLHLKRASVMARGLKIAAKPAATPTTMYKSTATKAELLLSEAYYLFVYYAFRL